MPDLTPKLTLYFEYGKHIDPVPDRPGFWSVWAPWRGDRLVGFTAHGDKDQVLAAFNEAVQQEYLRELMLYAKEMVVDRQPQKAP
jgi:hypothetical protein